MKPSRCIVVGVSLCIWGCADSDGEVSDAASTAFVPDASSPFDAGSSAAPEAGVTLVTSDAGSSASMDSGFGSGFPRWDGGFPFSWEGGFPWSSDAGGGGTAVDAGSAVSDAGGSSDGGDPYENARQVCVDTINMYRATLNLPPLKRAPASTEACSDKGAKKDGDSMQAHGSAGSCPGMGAQNTCPGYPVGGFGAKTLEDALKGCLAQMWAEGVPDEGVSECINKYFKGDTACFLAHGHYINMSSSDSTVVSCGFYDMGGSKFWMNQDFGR